VYSMHLDLLNDALLLLLCPALLLLQHGTIYCVSVLNVLYALLPLLSDALTILFNSAILLQQNVRVPVLNELYALFILSDVLPFLFSVLHSCYCNMQECYE
jgi:hypothetical protein